MEQKTNTEFTSLNIPVKRIVLDKLHIKARLNRIRFRPFIASILEKEAASIKVEITDSEIERNY